MERLCGAEVVEVLGAVGLEVEVALAWEAEEVVSKGPAEEAAEEHRALGNPLTSETWETDPAGPTN